MRTRTVAMLLTAALAVLLAAPPAVAGGSWLEPVQEDLQPGDTVTFIGYVGHGQLGWVEDGPFFAYLRVERPAAGELSNAGFPNVLDTDLPLGQIDIDYRGELGYLSLRLSITFEVPADVPAGEYPLVYCNDPCTDGIGDLIGGTVYVGVDYGDPGCREWAFDEPEIANLPPDAELCGPGGSGTAAEVLAGTVTQEAGGSVHEDDDAVVREGTAADLEELLRRSRDAQSIVNSAEYQSLLGAELLARYQSAELLNQQALGAPLVSGGDDGISPWLLTAVVLGFTGLVTVGVARLTRRREPG